jgi:hypothetical protein
MTDDEARAFIDMVEWHEAVTWRSRAPHEYCLRHEAARAGRLDEFVGFAALIMSRGRDRIFGGQPWTSLYLGEFYFWTAGAGRNSPPAETTVINRALRDQPTPEPRQLRLMEDEL